MKPLWACSLAGIVLAVASLVLLMRFA